MRTSASFLLAGTGTWVVASLLSPIAVSVGNWGSGGVFASAVATSSISWSANTSGVIGEASLPTAFPSCASWLFTASLNAGSNEMGPLDPRLPVIVLAPAPTASIRFPRLAGGFNSEAFCSAACWEQKHTDSGTSKRSPPHDSAGIDSPLRKVLPVEGGMPTDQIRTPLGPDVPEEVMLQTRAMTAEN